MSRQAFEEWMSAWYARTPKLNQTPDMVWQAATNAALERLVFELKANVEQLRKNAERKPMTDEDILRIYGLSKSTTDFARNIELFIAEGTP